MSRNETQFQFASRGATSVYKFRFAPDGPNFVWFEAAGGEGSLYTTSMAGPYAVADDLGDAEVAGLDALLAAHGTSKRQWVEDLMAQFGEWIAWTYP